MQNQSLANRLLHNESTPAILLIIFALLAMLLKNSVYAEQYSNFLLLEVEVRADAFSLKKPLLLWVNDGLMAIFFFLIGLELKRELLIGQLSQPKNIVLPIIGAAGGIIVPAAVYLLFNYQNQLSAHGWAIPTATDIAFSLGILALLGTRAPSSLKLFLLTLAIVDDLVGILVIAVFYTSKLSLLSLASASIGLIGMFVLNRLKVKRIAPYVLFGILVWICFLKSGVHATLAGVINALFIPLVRSKDEDFGAISNHRLTSNLHPYVYFLVLPVFAFVNAGVVLENLSLANLSADIPIGIFLGLFVGKPLGVLLFCGMAILLGLSQLPKHSNWMQFSGVAFLCGIGFTMSLFIASLAFSEGGAGEARIDRLAILLGSGCSAIVGVLLLWLASPSQKAENKAEA
jgi:NhaA family Na+:H+ antiporter